MATNSRTLDRLKEQALALQMEMHALLIAYRDVRTPWLAKVCAFLVVAYALSPIDLIPDFIPVVGYLDDLILVPAGIALVIRLIPDEVMESARDEARTAGLPSGRIQRAGAMLVVCIWLILLVLVVFWVVRWVKRTS